MASVSSKKLLALVSLGAVLEYYDFAIFIYLAPAIGASLIPIKNASINLIVSYAIFAIGAIVRPLGGLLFAHFGDTRGRKFTFAYTILFMAIPTLLIAFIPNSASIGVYATILLLFLRVMQGLAVGGEIPGSIVFGYELAHKKHKAINSAVIAMGINVGFLIASVVCSTVLKEHVFLAFAPWRLAFILGGIFGIISYILRSQLVETPAFSAYRELVVRETVPIKLLFKRYYKPVLQLLAIGTFFSSSLAVFMFYMPTYLSHFYHFPIIKLLQFNSYTIVLFISGSLIAGLWDKHFGKRFFLSLIVMFTLGATLLFTHYSSLSLREILMAHIVMLLVLGVLCGRFPVWCATFFPVAVRYTGVGIVYNVSFGIVAGSTQMLLTWLIHITNILWLPAVYIAIFAIWALITVIKLDGSKLVDYND